jgi:peptide methionine sulfoxide reductase msrA/msrB
MYFETHDPTQVDGQGPDIGTQYRSEIFFTDKDQEKVAKKLIAVLEEKGYKVVTNVSPAAPFYEAEDYHQDYYDHKGSSPYCHIYKAKF